MTMTRQLAKVMDVVEELLPKIRAGRGYAEMIVDFERERTLPAFVADVCIVGAGLRESCWLRSWRAKASACCCWRAAVAKRMTRFSN